MPKGKVVLYTAADLDKLTEELRSRLAAGDDDALDIEIYAATAYSEIHQGERVLAVALPDTSGPAQEDAQEDADVAAAGDEAPPQAICGHQDQPGFLNSEGPGSEDGLVSGSKDGLGKL